jgi:hypothetical protein
MTILLLSQKTFKRQIKNTLINDDDIIIYNHTHFMEQQLNKSHLMYGT